MQMHINLQIKEPSGWDVDAEAYTCFKEFQELEIQEMEMCLITSRWHAQLERCTMLSAFARSWMHCFGACAVMLQLLLCFPT